MQTLIEKHWGQGDAECRLERIPSILIRNLKRPQGRSPSPGGSSSLGIFAIACSYGYELAQICDHGLACKSHVDRKMVNRSSCGFVYWRPCAEALPASRSAAYLHARLIMVVSATPPSIALVTPCQLMSCVLR